MCSLPVNSENVHRVAPKGTKSDLSGEFLQQTGMKKWPMLIDFGTLEKPSVRDTSVVFSSFSFYSWQMDQNQRPRFPSRAVLPCCRTASFLKLESGMRPSVHARFCCTRSGRGLVAPMFESCGPVDVG
jgi:hypothetical protein